MQQSQFAMQQREFQERLRDLEEQRRERQRQRELEERQLAQQQAALEYNTMLQAARGDPNKALEIFGDRFLDAAKRATGVEFPVEEVPVTRTDVLRRETGVQITPRTQPQPGFRPMREPKEGETSYYGVDVEPIITEQPVEVQVGTRRVIRGTLQPPSVLSDVFVTVGGVRMRASDFLDELREAGLSGQALANVLTSVLGIVDPNTKARLELETLRYQADREFQEARFKWEQYTEEQRRKLRELEIQINEKFQAARLALEKGRLEEAAWHNREMERLTAELRQIQRQQVESRQQGQRPGPDPATLRELEREYRRAEDRFRELKALLETKQPVVTIDNRFVTREQLQALAYRAGAALQRARQRLENYRRQTTHYLVWDLDPSGRPVQVWKSSAEIMQAIRNALARGMTRDQIVRMFVNPQDADRFFTQR